MEYTEPFSVQICLTVLSIKLTVQTLLPILIRLIYCLICYLQTHCRNTRRKVPIIKPVNKKLWYYKICY